MSEVPAVSVPTAAAAPKTSRDAFANLDNAPLPTVSTPTAPPAPKPELVEGAIRYEQGTGPATAPADSAEPGEPTSEPVDASAEPEAAPESVDWQQKFSELFDSGDLHETLHDKMLMAKIDGQEVPVSVKEALAGYMRRSNHSKAMNELSQQQHALQQETQRFQSMWQDLSQKPELALEVFGEKFGDQWLDQVVATRQRAKAEYDDAILGAGYRACAQFGLDPSQAASDQRVLQAMAQEQTRLDRARQLEAENKKLRRAQEQIDAQQQQAQSQQQSADYLTTFNATVKRFQDAALKAEGLTVNSINRAELSKAVAQVLIAQNHGLPEGKRSFSVTQDVVREAAQILKETRGGSQSQQAQEPALPARMGMGTGTGAPAKARPQTTNSRDAFKKLGF